MRLSDLQSKKIIDIVSGTNIGNIMDVVVNETGKIEALVLDQGKSFLSLSRETDKKILWENITKIGEDVILVKIE